MVHIILLNKQQNEKPHILVTVQFNPSGEQKVIKCVDLIYNVKQFALLDENDEPIFFSTRKICEVVNVTPIE